MYLYWFSAAVDKKDRLMARSKSSQNLTIKESPPPQLPSRSSIVPYDTVYVRERRGGLDCSRDVRSNSAASFHLDGLNHDKNSSEI